MKFFSILFLFFFFSCASKTTVPNGIIPVKEMTGLLWDVFSADALANYRYPLDSLKRFDTSVVLYQQIAKAHGTTQQQFKKSMQFYEGRPDLLQLIIDSLQQRSSQPLRTAKKDSLKNLKQKNAE